MTWLRSPLVVIVEGADAKGGSATMPDFDSTTTGQHAERLKVVEVIKDLTGKIQPGQLLDWRAFQVPKSRLKWGGRIFVDNAFQHGFRYLAFLEPAHREPLPTATPAGTETDSAPKRVKKPAKASLWQPTTRTLIRVRGRKGPDGHRAPVGQTGQTPPTWLSISHWMAAGMLLPRDVMRAYADEDRQQRCTALGLKMGTVWTSLEALRGLLEKPVEDVIYDGTFKRVQCPKRLSIAP